MDYPNRDLGFENDAEKISSEVLAANAICNPERPIRTVSERPNHRICARNRPQQSCMRDYRVKLNWSPKTRVSPCLVERIYDVETIRLQHSVCV
jgi:hypothetical protein